MTKYVSISVEKHFINIMRAMENNTGEQHDRGLKRSNEPSDMKPFFSPGEGTLGISGWGCAAGTLEPLTYTTASSAEFCQPILE